jgi:hypothetical protein
MHPIFLTPGRHAQWRAAIDSRDPAALAIERALRATSAADAAAPGDNERAEQLERALAILCLAWLKGDRERAEHGRGQLEAVLDSGPGSDLGKAAHALAAVLGWDFGAALWDTASRRAFAERLAGLARSFLDVTTGNPHTVTNNWWMLTHGGCLLACIAADGEPGVDADAPDGPSIADLKAWALERFRAFCGVFGDAGLYHEGSGYINYTLSMLMPALVAVERHLDPHILHAFPGLRRSLASICTGTATFEHTDNGAEAPSFGAALQWNDSGRGCIGLNPFMPALAVSPPHWQAALKGWFDRLLGVDGRGFDGCQYRGLPLTVALYPFSMTAVDPDGVLPNWMTDRRQGLGIWRSRWGDGSEAVFGWYARSTHPGGHSQDDAASIRLMCLGRTWICGGGQNRPRAEWQSVLTHADPAQRPRPAPLTHISGAKLQDSGGVVGIDTRNSLQAYSERYLAWRADAPYPFVLALLDLLDEHQQPPRDWQWNLSFPRELEASVDADGAGFRLVDPERGRLSARFLIDRPASLEIRDMPAASRTYANGRKVDYPGDRFVHAAFPGHQHGRILVCAVITRTDEAEPEIAFADNAIGLDGQPWRNPFAPLILPTVDLAQSAPNRMTRPAG